MKPNLTTEPLTSESIALMKRRYPKVLATLILLFDAKLKKEGIDKTGLADKLIIEMSYYLGGRDIYLPSGKTLLNALRNSQIYREFNGKNLPELASKYDLTDRRILSIVEEQRCLLRQQRDENPAKFPDGVINVY